MALNNIKASLNGMPLSNIDITNFTIDYSKRVNQIKVLTKKSNTFFKTLIIIKELCLLHLANRVFITLQ